MEHEAVAEAAALAAADLDGGVRIVAFVAFEAVVTVRPSSTPANFNATVYGEVSVFRFQVSGRMPTVRCPAPKRRIST